MEDQNNVINNYKGVMLCSRPNEVNVNQTQKPFCARVVPPSQIGLVPCAKDKPQIQQKKKKGGILSKHKKWLQEYKQYHQVKKESEQFNKMMEEEKFKKIRQQCQDERERARQMKEEYNKTATNVINILDDKPTTTKLQLNAQNLKKLNQENQKNQESFKKVKKDNKNQKPLWAQTEKQVEEQQEKELDDLLDYFENTEVKKYSEDQQVKEILKHLKEKIQKLKQQENWKEKQAKRIKKKKEQNNQYNQNQNKKQQDDKYSNYSVKSDIKSIASEKTQKKIQQLKEKLEKKKQGQQQWDKYTVSSKHLANIQDKIAKNLADEVLRNYPNLKGVHSNNSIRKLLQAEATKAIFEPINRPVITTIVRQKIPLDSNNLPYLHRNPAI